MDEKSAFAYQSNVDDILTNPRMKETKSKISSRPELVKSVSRSSLEQEKTERECSKVGTVDKDSYKSEHRTTPETFFQVKNGIKIAAEVDNNSEGQPVDDIAMSPLPYDREDPVTLLDLPDDILTLPISPCGPHDDPVQAG